MRPALSGTWESHMARSVILDQFIIFQLSFLVIFLQLNSLVLASQCEYFLVALVSYDSKLNFNGL